MKETNNTSNSSNSLTEIAKRTFNNESNAIKNLSELIDDDFYRSVECILNSKGRVIISGVGKSALIASKIVATLNSTGTPAIFMHAADAIHGDLGTVLQDDVVICISKSGNTEEVKMLIPLIKRGGNKLIAITGNISSVLAKQADFILNTFVEKEACPNNLAPTTSTTAQLVMGDALAIALLETRGFSSDDFAKYHPGGSLGKRLYLRVSDIVEKNEKPKVAIDTPIKQAIVEISKKMLGVTAVTENEKVVGIITDGDIRRMLNQHDNIKDLTAGDIMTKSPKTIQPDILAIKAMETLRKNGISQLLVLDGDDYKGVIHIHNLINEGLA